MNRVRIFVGVLLAPLVYVAVWSYPFIEHSAFHTWLILNSVGAYITFLLLAGFSHKVLELKKYRKIQHYCFVMLVVSLVSFLTINYFSILGFESLYYSETVVVKGGHITGAGYLLKLKEAAANSLISVVAMAVFWFCAVYRNGSIKSVA